MSDDQTNVTNAYTLASAEQRKRFYAQWAATYDDDFAFAENYVFPQEVARVFRDKDGIGPVLDAGAGTGLVAFAIRQQGKVVLDAFDLSAEMLAVAHEKALYRNLIQGDLTQGLPFEDGAYSAVVSAGTFTHGHVGADALDELLRVAAPGALFVLTIKAEIYETHGFAAKFANFGGTIRDFEMQDAPIYRKGSNTANATDKGLIVSFTRI